MKKWLKRIGSAVLMGLAWAVVWGPVGVLVGLIVDPDGSMDEMWVAVGAYPGFLCGVVFFALMAIAAARRRFDETPNSGAAVRGVIAGLLVATSAFLMVSTSQPPQWMLGGAVLGSITLMSAVSGIGTVLLLRSLSRWQPERVAPPPTA